MGRGLKIHTEGLTTTISYLDMINTNVTTVIQEEVEAGAKVIRDRERELAPVRTGGPKSIKRRIVIRKGKQGITDMVQAKAPHSHLQEYGTKRGVKAKNFAKQARDEKLPGVQARILARVAKEVKR